MLFPKKFILFPLEKFLHEVKIIFNQDRTPSTWELVYILSEIHFHFFLLYYDTLLVLGNYDQKICQLLFYVSYFSINTSRKPFQPIHNHIVLVFKVYHTMPPPYTDSRKPSRALQNKCHLIIFKPWKSVPIFLIR